MCRLAGSSTHSQAAAEITMTEQYTPAHTRFLRKNAGPIKPATFEPPQQWYVQYVHRIARFSQVSRDSISLVVPHSLIKARIRREHVVDPFHRIFLVQNPQQHIIGWTVVRFSTVQENSGQTALQPLAKELYGEV